MKILTVNDKKEEKFLRRKTVDFDFKAHNKKEINKLIKQLKEIMIKSNGVGLSANQVGLNLRFFIVQLPTENISVNQRSNPRKSALYTIFNPKIKISAFSRKKTEMEEGCLSVPGVYGIVKRYEKITLIGQGVDAKKIKIKAEGLLSRVFQHEVDHLNGILFVDKAINIKKLENS